MTLFIKWTDKLNKILSLLLGIILLVMTLSVGYQVIIRFLLSRFELNISAPWTEELSRYLMIWLIFLGAAYATRYSKLISIELLETLLPKLARNIVKIISLILSVVFYIVIFIIGYKWATFGLSETSTVMHFSMFYVYLSMPLSAIIMVINTLAYLIETVILQKGEDVNINYDL